MRAGGPDAARRARVLVPHGLHDEDRHGGGIVVMIPARIGDYHIVDVLGRGGMGVVYRATHPSGNDLAVKTVRVATESTLASIRREVQTLRELRHPGVVAIRDHGVADGMPWYAMDLLRGRTLRDDLNAWFPAPAALAASAPTLPIDQQHLAPTVDLRGPRA